MIHPFIFYLNTRQFMHVLRLVEEKQNRDEKNPQLNHTETAACGTGTGWRVSLTKTHCVEIQPASINTSN